MGAIAEPAFSDIQRRLDAIVSTEGVRLLWAAESGSRAWGFPSPDSDYDVRFVHARPLRRLFAPRAQAGCDRNGM